MARFAFSGLRGHSLVLFTTCSALVMFGSVSSAQVVWINTGSDFWNNQANWKGGALPGDGQIPCISNGGTATIDTAGFYPSANNSYAELWAGNGNGNGNVVQDTGTTVNVANSFDVGRMNDYVGPQIGAANNVSTYTMYGGSIVNSNSAAIGGGLTNNGVLSSSTGVLTLNDSAQFTSTGLLDIGDAGIGTVIQSGGTINGGQVWLGQNGGTGKYTMLGGQFASTGFLDIGGSGTGSCSINKNATIKMSGSGSYFILGDNAAASGTFEQNDMSVVSLGSSGSFIDHASVGAGGTGSYTLNSGTLNAYTNNYFIVGDRAGGTGAMYINGGVANITGGLIVGNSTSSQGTVTMTAGQVTADYATIGAGGTGYLNMSGNSSLTLSAGNGFILGFGGTGYLNMSGNSSLTLSAGNGFILGFGGSGVVNMSGGTIAKTGGGNIVLGSQGGSGTWNMNGGMVYNNASLILGDDFSTGNFYLIGGTVQAQLVTSYGQGTGNFYFNGGVLQATGGGILIGTNNDYPGAPNAIVQKGGAIIDTNGNTTTIAQPLQHDTGGPAIDGGLTKNGAGTLILTGPNTYTGATKVNGGTLLAMNAGALPGYKTSGGTVNIAGGATLAVQTGDGTIGWSSSQIGSLLISASWANNTAALGIDTTNGDFTYSSTIARSLAFTKMGTHTLTLANSNFYTGGTTVNGGTLQLGNIGALGSGGLTVNNGAVDLAGYSPTVPSLSGGSAGTITNSFSSAKLTVNQASTTTFGGNLQDGVGKLALLKAGTGTLILAGSDSYTGGTTVSAGQLVVTSNLAIADRTSLTVAAGGTFVFDPSLVGTPVSGGQVPATSPAGAVSAVPEPGTLALLIAGVAVGLGVWRRRKGI